MLHLTRTRGVQRVLPRPPFPSCIRSSAAVETLAQMAALSATMIDPANFNERLCMGALNVQALAMNRVFDSRALRRERAGV